MSLILNSLITLGLGNVFFRKHAFLHSPLISTRKYFGLLFFIGLMSLVNLGFVPIVPIAIPLFIWHVAIVTVIISTLGAYILDRNFHP